MGRIIGIDLGTTNSVVATVGAGGCKIIQNKEAEQMTRSIVGAYRNDYLIGTPAMNHWPLAPKDTIISIKRLMGRSNSDHEVEMVRSTYLYQIAQPSDGTKDSICVLMGGKEFTPVEISAMILKKLKTDAEFALGEPVTHAVITVPAYFSEKQIDATREAGIKAGLTVMKIIDEPTAAAVAYGIDSREQDAKTILVYDLGGGTFDISILMMSAGAYAILDREGDMWLGGDNFDQIIVDDVVETIQKEYGVDPRNNFRFMATLKIEARKAKETLGAAPVANILIPGLLRDPSGDLIDIDLEITREFFAKKSAPLVAKTVSLTKKAMENAHLTMEDIDYVLMAGNSTCMPIVQQAMEELFGDKKILRNIHPKNCVAMGAAMAAAVLRGIDCPKCGSINDLNATKCEKCGCSFAGIQQKKACPNCGEENDPKAEKCAACGAVFIKKGSVDGGNAPFSYGIQTAGDTFTVFIKKNDRYPTPENKREFQEFRTIFPNQRTADIPVYGGDNMEKASANEKQGEAFVTLPPGRPEGSIVRVKIWLDENGRFDISAQMGDGKDLKPRVIHSGRDKTVAELIRKIEYLLTDKETILTEHQKAAFEMKLNGIIKTFEEGKIEEASQNAESLICEIEAIQPPPPPGLLGYLMHLINEYGWMMGEDAYPLNKVISELSEATKKNDKALIAAKEQEGMQIVEAMCASNELLEAFTRLEILILSNADQSDPVLGRRLLGDLSNINQAFKRGDPGAASMLEDLINRLPPPPPPPPEIICTCGASNKPDAKECWKCHANLRLLGGGNYKNIITSSNQWGAKQ